MFRIDLEGKPLEPRPVYSIQLIKNRSFGYPITNGTIVVWDGDYKLIHYIEDKKSLLFNYGLIQVRQPLTRKN